MRIYEILFTLCAVALATAFPLTSVSAATIVGSCGWTDQGVRNCTYQSGQTYMRIENVARGLNPAQVYAAAGHSGTVKWRRGQGVTTTWLPNLYNDAGVLTPGLPDTRIERGSDDAQ